MMIVIVAAITGAGLVTGLLFAFSNFVMRALSDLPNAYGMFAMQRVNQTIINPLFLGLFLGTPILCAIIAVDSAGHLDNAGGLFLLAGSIAYLAGPFAITVLFNVPLNTRLASADRSSADEVWPVYQKRWQRWNHLRTAVGTLSILLLAAGLGFAQS